jgi:hypothetical protein
MATFEDWNFEMDIPPTKKGINFKPPIVRVFTVTILFSALFFWLSSCLSFYTMHITLAGDTIMLVFLGLFGFAALVTFSLMLYIVYKWAIKEGSYDPLAKTERMLCKLLESNAELMKKLDSSIKESKENREIRHGQQPTIDESEDM